MSESFIIVHQIDKRTPLGEYIPLHMTALPWFEADSQELVVAKLGDFVLSQDAVLTKAVEEDMFGPNLDIPVMRLDRSPALLGLHMGLLALAKAQGWQVELWAGEDGWNPHVTHQPEARLGVGDEVYINNLDLIRRRSDGNKEFIRRFDLRSPNA